MKRYDLMIATKNLNKVKEIKKIITGYDVNIMTFIDFPQMPDVVEDGSTIEENSKKKAIETAKYTGLISIADVLLELLNSPEKNSVMGENCRGIFMDKYTRSKCTNKYVHMINAILKTETGGTELQ